jgi:hypothetical protein
MRRHFEEVKQLGGDGVVTPTVRTIEQTGIGIYWPTMARPAFVLHLASITKSQPRSPIKWP